MLSRFRTFRRLHQVTYVSIALVFVVTALFPLFDGKAYAVGQITSRSIQMSSSAIGPATAQYTMSFKPATTGVIESIAIDFCDDSPLIGVSCAWNTGQSLSIASATFTSITGTPDTTVGASNWKISANANSASAGNGVILALTDASATESGSSVTAGTTITIVISNIVNPHYTSSGLCPTANQPNCSFYGRMLTYTTTAGATSYAATSIGTPTDAGGVALSTAAQIQITAKVQETLAFCVFSTASSGTCGTAPNVALGNTNGVLVTTGPFVDINTTYTVQTNAGGGVAINVQGDTLKTAGGTFSIAALASPTASAAGTSQFGMCTWQSSGTTLTPVANYNGGAGHLCSTATQTAGTGSTGGAGSVQFYFPTTNTTTTYGDTIANDTAGATATGIVAFLGNVSATQQAGIYTTTLGLIANGTY